MPGDNTDARWSTYGMGLGLLYEYHLSTHLSLTPSLRVGLATMENHATYNGPQTSQLRVLFDGILLNWNTNASVISVALG